MRVRMRLFGPLREAAATAEGWREVREGSSVGDLMVGLRYEVGMSEGLLGASAVAVNQEYVGLERVLVEGDEVAILPPVSGGRR